MRLDLALIPVVLGLAAAALLALKPVEVKRPDLSAVFLYWPEAYRYAEDGDPTAIYRVAPLVVCNGDLGHAPPGLSYRVLSVVCRFKP
ncbi:MAG: hypothetical protein ACP5H5_00240 [Pyrobaculum sp.]|jgi:hypothetical protein